MCSGGGVPIDDDGDGVDDDDDDGTCQPCSFIERASSIIISSVPCPPLRNVKDKAFADSPETSADGIVTNDPTP